MRQDSEPAKKLLAFVVFWGAYFYFSFNFFLPCVAVSAHLQSLRRASAPCTPALAVAQSMLTLSAKTSPCVWKENRHYQAGAGYN